MKAQPTDQRICAARDEKYEQVLFDLADAIVTDGGYNDVDPRVVADTLSSMTDGMWLSCLVNPKSFSREAARHAIRTYLKAMFPRHYE